MQQASTEIVELTVGETLDCTRVAAHASMYTVANWLLCTFDFGADTPRCYPVQCERGASWEAPRASPKELDHHRRLEALLHFDVLDTTQQVEQLAEQDQSCR